MLGVVIGDIVGMPIVSVYSKRGIKPFENTIRENASLWMILSFAWQWRTR